VSIWLFFYLQPWSTVKVYLIISQISVFCRSASVSWSLQKTFTFEQNSTGWSRNHL